MKIKKLKYTFPPKLILLKYIFPPKKIYIYIKSLKSNWKQTLNVLFKKRKKNRSAKPLMFCSAHARSTQHRHSTRETLAAKNTQSFKFPVYVREFLLLCIRFHSRLPSYSPEDVIFTDDCELFALRFSKSWRHLLLPHAMLFEFCWKLIMVLLEIDSNLTIVATI